MGDGVWHQDQGRGHHGALHRGRQPPILDKCMMPLVELVRNSITTEEAVFDMHRKQGLTMEDIERSTGCGLTISPDPDPCSRSQPDSGSKPCSQRVCSFQPHRISSIRSRNHIYIFHEQSAQFLLASQTCYHWRDLVLSGET